MCFTVQFNFFSFYAIQILRGFFLFVFATKREDSSFFQKLYYSFIKYNGNKRLHTSL